MSNAQIVIDNLKSGPADKPVYTPTRVLKMDLQGALSRRIAAIVAAADGGNISGRHIGLKRADYAALAGAANADSVATAITYAVVNFFNGNDKLQDLTAKPVPAWLAARVQVSLSTAKPRNGCDEDALRTYAGLIQHGIASAVKPEEPKAKPAVVPVAVPAPDSVSAAVPAPLTALELREAIASLGGSLDNAAAANAESAYAQAEARALAAAQAEEQRAARLKAFEAEQIALFAAREKSIHARAVAFAELATFFGIKLSKAQLAALDRAEGKVAA